MALADILTWVRGEVAAATGTTAAQVHDGIRWAKSEAEFRSLFRVAATGRVHGWMVTWDGADEEYRTGSVTNLSRRTHSIRCVGVYALDDPGSGTTMTSELAFRVVVEAVCDRLRGKFDAGGNAEQVSAPEVAIFEPRTIRGVLVHYTEIVFEVVERKDYTA